MGLNLFWYFDIDFDYFYGCRLTIKRENLLKITTHFANLFALFSSSLVALPLAQRRNSLPCGRGHLVSILMMDKERRRKKEDGREEETLLHNRMLIQFQQGFFFLTPKPTIHNKTHLFAPNDYLKKCIILQKQKREKKKKKEKKEKNMNSSIYFKLGLLLGFGTN